VIVSNEMQTQLNSAKILEHKSISKGSGIEQGRRLQVGFSPRESEEFRY
jgi:hypothetical protein